MVHSRTSVLFPVALCALVCQALSADAGAVLIWLGDLPNGMGNNGANAVSADGLVVVGSADTELGREAYRWTAETGMVGLGDLPGGGYVSLPMGVSGDGSVVAGISMSANSDDRYYEAFRWTEQTGMVGLGDFPGDGFASYAYGVSADGSVIVGSGQHGGPGTPKEACRWEGDEMIGLGYLMGGDGHSAMAASADGSVIVGSGHGDVGYSEAFRWTTETGMVGMGHLPGGGSSIAMAVSADGSVIVGGSSCFNGSEAFRWTAEEGMIGLGDLPGGYFKSTATGVSGDGSIIVGYSHVGGDLADVPFIWDAQHAMRDLHDVFDELGVDVGDRILAPGVAISADGLTLVGAARDPDWNFHSWAVSIPPGTGDKMWDGSIDLYDAAYFQECMVSSGPSVDAPMGCRFADFDFDGDIDLTDFAAFQNAFTGAP